MIETSRATMSIEVFFSYSHRDEELRNELSKHLATLKRQNVITGWHDRKIVAGEEWKNEIDTHLNTADIILLLVSSDFLASGYCYDVEVKQAMERHLAKDTCVIPVILRPVDWKGTPFGSIQALSTDAKPVTTWPNRDEAFLNIAEGIRKAIEKLVTDRINPLFDKLSKAESLRNWPNVIDIGERILELLPDDQPTRSRTAAAFFKRWSSKSDETSELFHNLRIHATDSKTGRKRYIDVWDLETRIHDEILSDINRAIELDPNNAEYYYWRSQFDYNRKIADLTRAIELDPNNGKYYFMRSRAIEAEDENKAKRDLQRAVELGDKAAALIWRRTSRSRSKRLR